MTNTQYAEFLNSVDPTGADPLNLYLDQMNNQYGYTNGLSNAGQVDGSRYFAKPGWENKPINYVGWFRAARFVNWLHNGQGNGGTESGAYNLLGNTEMPLNRDTVTRESDATYFIPSEDEWYKAAYHDASSGTAGDYFLYPHTSNDVPASAPPDIDPGAMNIRGYNGEAPRVHFDYPFWDGSFEMSPLTDVGAYHETISPYGTYDQGGNVWELNEAMLQTQNNGVYRGLRGSSYNDHEGDTAADDRNFSPPFHTDRRIGFRVATVIPEPASLFFFAAGGLIIAKRRL